MLSSASFRRADDSQDRYQEQAAGVAPPGAHAAPKEATSTKEATTRKGAPKGKKRAAPEASAPVKAPKGVRKAAKVAPAKAKASKATKAVQKPGGTAVPREFSKTAIVLDMLKAKGGATNGRY